MNKLTFEDIDRLVELSQEPLEDRYIELGNEKGEPYYRFLYHLVHQVSLTGKSNLCLEIGVGWGLGSAHMCSITTRVIGIDINRTILIDGLIAACPDYRFLNCDSISQIAKDNVAKLVDKYGPIGIVFQDSSHHYYASCQEWKIYTPFLDDNAIWICDDITESFYRPGLDEKSMVGYFEERPGEKRLYDNLHHGSTIGVILL